MTILEHQIAFQLPDLATGIQECIVDTNALVVVFRVDHSRLADDIGAVLQLQHHDGQGAMGVDRGFLDQRVDLLVGDGWGGALFEQLVKLLRA